MYSIYVLPHWKIFSTSKADRSEKLREAIVSHEASSSLILSTITYTKNASYVMSGFGDEIYGMDAYDRHRRLPMVEGLPQYKSSSVGKLKYVSMQEAVYKSIKFYDIEVSEDKPNCTLNKVGCFTYTCNGHDNITIFHAIGLNLDYEFVHLHN